MLIGGYDVQKMCEDPKERAKALLKAVGAMWPLAVVEVDAAVLSIPEMLAADVTTEYLYVSEDASWKADCDLYGVTDANASHTFLVSLESDAVCTVVDSPQSPIGKLVVEMLSA